MDLKLIVAILAIAVVPVCAQAQQPSAAKLKADAQNVVKIISGDKAKTQTYCQVSDIAKQMDEAVQEKDRKKAEELSQKLTESETHLGPEYLALVESLRNMDLTSKDGQEIVSTFDKLDESCPH
jgi:outer membrane lipoprotein-sorting protein